MLRRFDLILEPPTADSRLKPTDKNEITAARPMLLSPTSEEICANENILPLVLYRGEGRNTADSMAGVLQGGVRG